MYFTDWSMHDEFRNSDNLKRKSCSVVRQRGGRPYMHLIPDSSGMNRVHWRLGVVFCVLLMCLTVLITCSTALMSWVWWLHKQVPAAVMSGLRLEAHATAFENQQNRGAFFCQVVVSCLERDLHAFCTRGNMQNKNSSWARPSNKYSCIERNSRATEIFDWKNCNKHCN